MLRYWLHLFWQDWLGSVDKSNYRSFIISGYFKHSIFYGNLVSSYLLSFRQNWPLNVVWSNWYFSAESSRPMTSMWHYFRIISLVPCSIYYFLPFPFINSFPGNIHPSRVNSASGSRVGWALILIWTTTNPCFVCSSLQENLFSLGWLSFNFVIWAFSTLVPETFRT